ncbi:MAG: signal peptidase I [Bacilli bacterium]|uniref:signal peptidase I n=1 Tax=Clostridium sp. TaxID=1506 RepID=UPI002FCB6B74
MKTIRKTVIDIIFVIFIVAVISIGVMFSNAEDSSSGRKIFGYSIFNVLTGSMEPEIKEGSLIITKEVPINDINVNDVITIRTNTNGSLVTHRVVVCSKDKDGIYFKTKGDANDVTDSFEVREKMIEGKVVFNIPYLGSFISFVKENILIVCMFITGMFIVTSSLKKGNRSKGE